MAAHRPHSFAQEAIRRSHISPMGQHGVDQPTVVIDSSKQVPPAPAESYIGLIHLPGA
jgi:hypothetical protein